MNDKNKPKNLDFSAMEKKLREMGVSSDLEHLKKTASSPQPVPSTRTTSVSVSTPSSSQNAVAPKMQLPDDLIIDKAPEREASDWCNYVFGTLLSIYESTWIKSYGRRPTGRFLDFADNLTEAQLMRIIQHCRARLQDGQTWPPIMGELTLLQSKLTDSELADALSRVIDKTPKGELELWILQNKTFELRQLPQHLLNKRFKEYYQQAMTLQEKGQLNTKAVLALGQHSVKSMTDIKREEYEHEHGKVLHPRIQAIIDKKKQQK